MLAGEQPVVDTVTLTSIGLAQLPFRQQVTLSTSSLRIQLDEMLLSVEFDNCVRGHLLITPAGETAVQDEKWYIAEIDDIPTATELQLECPQDSNKLSVRFQRSQNCIVCISFVWESLSLNPENGQRPKNGLEVSTISTLIV
jgi:hypothetical protein